jgi:hypothetical protein
MRAKRLDELTFEMTLMTHVRQALVGSGYSTACARMEKAAGQQRPVCCAIVRLRSLSKNGFRMSGKPRASCA